MIKYDTNILERYLATYCLTLEKEYKFAPKRRFKADYAITGWRLLLEIEGGIFTKQAHGSITGILRDIEKYNLAMIYGFQVLRFTPEQFKKTQGIDIIESWRLQRSKT